MIEMWEHLADKCSDFNSIKIPLDQSHFDWQQNMRMIEAFCDVTKEFIQDRADGPHVHELLDMMDRIKIGLTHPGSKVTLGDKNMKGKNAYYVEIDVKGGVLSGWRWTALMDTVFNWGEMYCAKTLLRQQGMGTVTSNVIAQGDDDAVETPGAGQAAGLVEAYRVMNFEVNPSKFFVDWVRDEYLRQVAEPGLVSGYLIRGVNSILWRNPSSKDPPGGMLRAKEQLKAWNLVIGRGADESVALRMMKRDISRGNGDLPLDVVEALLYTPTTVGGLGLYRDLGKYEWYEFKPGVIERDTEVRAHEVVGLDKELSDYESLGFNITKEEAIKFIEPSLSMEDAKEEVIPGGLKPVPRLHLLIDRVPMKDTFYVEEDLEVEYTFGESLIVPTWERSNSIPLAAVPNHELPKTLSGLILDKALDYGFKTKDWTKVELEWLQPGLASTSRNIRERGGATVWVNWLRGKLPFHPPVILGWSDMVPSFLYKLVVAKLWARTVHRNKFNMSYIKRVALTAEDMTRELVMKRHVRMGG